MGWAVLAAALMAGGCAARAQGLGAPGEMRPPLEPLAVVDEVDLRRDDATGGLVIVARGQANTGGWSEPRLVRVAAVAGAAPAPEGVASFVLAAAPPQGMATQAFARVETAALWPQPPQRLRGVRVLARSGCAGAWVAGAGGGDPCGAPAE